jgi:hypothetical protein
MHVLKGLRCKFEQQQAESELSASWNGWHNPLFLYDGSHWIADSYQLAPAMEQ